MNPILKTLILPAWLLGVSMCLAAPGRVMTFDDVLSVDRVHGPAISPDGRFVAYLVTERLLDDNRSLTDLWLVSTDEVPRAVRLTSDSMSERAPTWSPDGKTLAFLVRRNGKTQVWLMDLESRERRQLTRSETDVRSFVWSPDGRRVAYVAPDVLGDRSDIRVILDPPIEKWGPTWEGAMHHLWLVDVESGKTRRLTEGEGYSISNPDWSPDGKRLAFVSRPTAQPYSNYPNDYLTDLWSIDVETGQRQKITENPGPDRDPAWSPDGKWIAYLARGRSPRVIGLLYLHVVSAAGGHPRIVAPDFQGSILKLEWSPEGNEILLSAGVGLNEHLYAVNVKSGRVTEIVDRHGTGNDFSISSKGDIAILRGDSTHAEDVFFRIRGSEVSLRKLTHHNPQLDDWELGKTENVRWISKDGTSIEGILIKPVGYRPGERVPTLVYIHGGPNSAYTHRFPSVRNYGHWWAGQGWAVFYPNFRGSTNYGDAFMGGNVRDWGGRDFDDVMTGLDHLISEGIADPERLAVAGWSYGGYLTAWIISQTDRFRAASYGAGTFNLISMYGDSGLQLLMEAYLGRPWEEPELYQNRSAVTFETQIKTPTIVFQGERDSSVPHQQAQDLFMSLQKRGVPSRFVLFPRAGHGISEPKQILEKMRLESQWIKKYVLGEEGQ